MGKISKKFALILILSIVIVLILIIFVSSQSLLVNKSAQPQNNTTPTISILYPTNDTVFTREHVYEDRFQLKYHTSDALSWVGYSVDGAENVTVIGNETYYHNYDISGYHNLTVYANDTAGNWATPKTVTYFTIVHSGAIPFYLFFFTPTSIVAVIVAVAIILLIYFKWLRKNKLTEPKTPQTMSRLMPHEKCENNVFWT